MRGRVPKDIPGGLVVQRSNKNQNLVSGWLHVLRFFKCSGSVQAARQEASKSHTPGHKALSAEQLYATGFLSGNRETNKVELKSPDEEHNHSRLHQHLERIGARAAGIIHLRSPRNLKRDRQPEMHGDTH